MSSEITAELIEDVFGKHSDSVRFASFCNAVVIAESSASPPTMPILSEKPGADGGMDGEWVIPSDGSTAFKSPFGLPGWNVFQYKARSIAGDGRQQAFSKLCSDLDGALGKLVARLVQPKECRRYSLFTNLQLGLETTTKTRDEKVLQKQRTQLTNSIGTWELIRLIGERDMKKHFLSRFESEVGERAGNWRFGHYCFGLNRADSKFVENYLNLLCEKPEFSKSSLLRPIEFIGPTSANHPLPFPRARESICGTTNPGWRLRCSLTPGYSHFAPPGLQFGFASIRAMDSFAPAHSALVGLCLRQIPFAVSQTAQVASSLRLWRSLCSLAATHP